MHKITAQVAAEAVLNNPDDYELADVKVVLADAVLLGVGAFYVDKLREIVDGQEEWIDFARSVNAAMIQARY